MKSLIQLDSCTINIGSSRQSGDEGRAAVLSDVAFDQKSGTLYVAIEITDNLEIWALPREGQDQNDSSQLVPELITTLPLSYNSRLLSFHFHTHTELVTIILSDGSISQLSPADGIVESIGTVDDGINTAQWSPDEEKLVLITSAPTPNLILMSRDFEPLIEQSLFTIEFGVDAPISVGWGKKATQFHGRQGKTAAKSTGPQWDDDVFDPLASDRMKNRLTWRGDSAFFAISSLDDQNPNQEDTLAETQSEKRLRRRIRIYNDTGVLSSTAEPIPRLSDCLAWKPSGNLLASMRLGPGTGTGAAAEVIFLERNGLRHGEFALRQGTDDVLYQMEKAGDWSLLDMLWNANSQVLALHIRTIRGECVQFWSMGNYHWYLKHTLEAPLGRTFQFLKWHATVPLRFLFALDRTKSLQWHDFGWTIIRDVSSVEPEERGLVAVVDGSSVLLTPFASMNIPPPYAGQTITLENDLVPKHVALGSHGLLAILTTPQGPKSCHVQVWHLPKKVSSEMAIVYQRSFEEIASASQIAISGSVSSPYVAILHQGGKSVACFNLDRESDTLTIPLEQKCIGLVGRSYGLAIHNLHSMSILHLTSLETTIIPLLEHNFLVTDFYIDHNGQPHFVGLDDSGRLIVDTQTIVTNANSFVLYCPATYDRAKLIYTTTEHHAHFVPLADFDGNGTSPIATNEDTRRVEKGSHIVTVVASTSALILQMPRGNLETVYPRALVLTDVRASIDRLDYKRAFGLCRRHRVEQSIMYYHDPQKFIETTDRFVTDVEQVDDLNSFVTNVGRSSDKNKNMSSDINNQICEAMRISLNRIDPIKYVRTILTTHVRKRPADYTGALEVLLQLKKTEAKATEDAIQYIIFLTDANLLFDHALGMYDYGLILMIAQYSQKDPREYLPLIRNLQSLPVYEQHFRINDRLKRYYGALLALKEGGEESWAKTQEYIVRHEIYEDALLVFASHPRRVSSIHGQYGNYLSDLGRHEDAAINLMLAGELESAATSYRKALCWREAFLLGFQLGHTPETIASQATEDAEELENAGRFGEAAVVWLDYAKDVEKAMTAFVKSNQFNEAHRTALLWNRPDLLETHVRPGAVTYCKETLEDISTWTTQFDKERARLAVIREKKKEAPNEFYMTGNNPILEDIDAVSEMSTTASRFTRYSTSASAMTGLTTSTNKTQRLKKREERKKASGKKGSVYEEEYLVASVGRLVDRVNTLQAQMPTLLISFVSLGLDRQARMMQKALLDLISHFSPLLDEVCGVTTEADPVAPLQEGDLATSDLTLKMNGLAVGSRPGPSEGIGPGSYKLNDPNWAKSYLK